MSEAKDLIFYWHDLEDLATRFSQHVNGSGKFVRNNNLVKPLDLICRFAATSNLRVATLEKCDLPGTAYAQADKIWDRDLPDIFDLMSGALYDVMKNSKQNSQKEAASHAMQQLSGARSRLERHLDIRKERKNHIDPAHSLEIKIHNWGRAYQTLVDDRRRPLTPDNHIQIVTLVGYCLPHYAKYLVRLEEGRQQDPRYYSTQEKIFTHEIHVLFRQMAATLKMIGKEGKGAAQQWARRQHPIIVGNRPAIRQYANHLFLGSSN